MFIDSLKPLKIVRENNRQRISLVENEKGEKFIKREIFDDKSEIYKLLQKINHRNIPEIYYVGLNENTEVVEEFVEGKTLADLLDEGIKISVKQIKSIIRQLLSALVCIHECGIIHRDVKPDNIIIDNQGRLWLTDFDIARIYREEIRKDTETMGTFGYAPIEQYGMMPTDFKTDIYSLGATMEALLRGRKNAGYLKKIALKCKKLDPAERYKSAKAVKHALLMQRIKYPIIGIAALAAVIVAVLGFPKGEIEKNVSAPNTSPKVDVLDKEERTENEQTSKDKLPVQTPIVIDTTENKAKENEKPQQQNEVFEGEFAGFEAGANETLLSEYKNFSSSCIFSTDEPYYHILFLDDINKKGKIKFGKNESVTEADITLRDGTLSVMLNDEKGNKFSHNFKFNNSYSYKNELGDDLRKNADIICYDLDDDGAKELLVGINECFIYPSDGILYIRFNYCIAWCIKYDESTGFILCGGDMFSKERPFSINSYVQKLNVMWEEFGDVTGYFLEGNKIVKTF